MGSSAYAIVTTLLALLGLVGLLSLRLFGLYSHQALALVLLLGCGWAVASRVWLARKGRLHRGLLRGLRGRDGRPQFQRRAVRSLGDPPPWRRGSARSSRRRDVGASGR